MSNRFATISLIVVVCILGGAFLGVVGLFMFPGISLFGLKYIGSGTHEAGPTKFNITQQVANMNNGNGYFSDIVINTYEVPINIVFTTSPVYEVMYYENFNGITTSVDLDYPMMSFSRGSLDEAIITTHEYHSFIYEATVSERFLQVYIPLNKVESNSSSHKWSLTINSVKSDVSFSKYTSSADDPREPRFYGLNINTSGKLFFNDREIDDGDNTSTQVYGTKVYATNFSYTTDNSIQIDAARTNMIDSTNYTLNSKRGNIEIQSAVEGNLDLTTNQGSINIVSCNDLTVKTQYGSVGCYGDKDSKIIVNGKANINAKAGSVDIGIINDNSGAGSEITTSSGNVSIGLARNQLKITTRRGSVDVKKGSSLDISTNIGRVKVLEVTDYIEVDTMRGNIYVGTDTTSVNNLDISTRIGKVDVRSAKGSVLIRTISSDVNFVNNNSSFIDIGSGGKLVAKGLQGTVTITAAKNTELDFTDISQGNTKVTLGDKCTDAKINALNNKPNDVYYLLKGKTVKLYEYRNNQPHLQDGQPSFDNFQSAENQNCKFDIQGSKALILVYFKAADSE